MSNRFAFLGVAFAGALTTFAGGRGDQRKNSTRNPGEDSSRGRHERIEYVVSLQPALGPSELNNRGAHFLSVVGRLKPGVSLRQAEADTSAVAARLAKRYPDTNATYNSMIVVPLHEGTTVRAT